MLNGVNNYTGATTVVSGTLETVVGGALPGGNNSGQALTIDSGATVNFNQTSSWIGALSGGGTIINGANANGILLGGNGWTSTFSGNIINSRLWYWGAGTTLNMTGSSSLTANSGFDGQGNPYYLPDTMNLSGTIDMVNTSLLIGSQGSFNVNVNGGYLFVPSTGAYAINLAGYNGSSGVAVNDENLTLNSGTISTPTLDADLTAGSAAAGVGYSTGTANIFVNGGVLSVGTIKNISTLTNIPMTLTLNGGTVQVAGNSGNFGNGALFADGGYSNELNVQIGTGGATINTNGLVTASQRPLNNIAGQASAGNLTVNGGGALNLSGSGTFTGRTIINNAAVRISNDYDLGAAPASLVASQVELNGGTLNFSSDLTGLSVTGFTSGSSSTITTVSASGVAGAALKMSNDILSLTGGTGGNFNTGSVGIVIAPPDMPGGVQATATVNLAIVNGTNQITGYTITNPGSGYSVPPAIYLTSTGGTVPSLNPTVAYYGITGSAGIESEGLVGSGSTPSLTFSNLGTSAATGAFTTSTSTALAATRGVQLDAAGGDLDVSNAPGGFLATVSGPVSGPGLLTKSGSGVLLLTNASNSWSGGTTITGGILDFADNAFPSNFGSSPLVVGSGGILAVPYGGPSDYTAAQVSTLLASGSFAAGSGIGFDTTNLSGTYGNNLSGSLALATIP